MCDARRMLLCRYAALSSLLLANIGHGQSCKLRVPPRTSARRPLRFPEPLIFACPATSYVKISIE